MIRFSPAPGLSLVMIPVLTLLIALGVWQVKRLHWKIELLASIEQGQAMPPAPLSSLLEAKSQGDLIAWRKAEVTGHIADEPVRALYAIKYGKPAQRALAPFIMDDGNIIAIDFGYIDHIPKPGFRLSHTGQTVTVQGILKPVKKPGKFVPPNQMDGLWYWPDTKTILAPFFANRTVENYVLDLDGPQAFPNWPEPAPAHANIPNNHLDYALTWFGLALAAIGIYFGWHKRTGRLRFGDKV